MFSLEAAVTYHSYLYELPVLTYKTSKKPEIPCRWALELQERICQTRNKTKFHR